MSKLKFKHFDMSNCMVRIQSVKAWVTKYKYAFLVLVLAIFIFIVVSLFIRHDWQLIIYGTLAFLIGSGLLVWIDDRKENRALKWLKAALVPIILAVGGLLTTQGWNLRGNYLNDRARFVAMAAELNLNRICLDLLNVTYDEYKVEGDPEIMTALLSPSTDHIRQVLSFSDLHSNDKKLLDMIFQYIFAADVLDAKIKQIDRVCSMHIVSNKMANEIVQSAFGNEHIFHAFFSLHKQLAGHLVSNYGWCYEEASNKIPKPIVDAFYLSIANRYIRLNSVEHKRRMQKIRDLIQKQGNLVPFKAEDPNIPEPNKDK